MDFDRVLEVVNKAKDIINKRGVESIRSSGRVFRQFTSYDGKDKVNVDDFIFGLRECGINLQKQDLDVILNFFDKDKDGMINFTEFLIALRGKPNDRRQAIIDKAFLKFDKEGTGLIDVTEIRQVYNCSKHPKVVSAEMSEEQVFSSFLKNFNEKSKQIIINAIHMAKDLGIHTLNKVSDLYGILLIFLPRIVVSIIGISIIVVIT